MSKAVVENTFIIIEMKDATDGHYKSEWSAICDKSKRRHHVKLKILNINLNQTGKSVKKEHDNFSEVILLHVTE